MKYKRLVNKIPEFCMSHWLIRIPLLIIFLQQGIANLPVTVEGAASFAAWGEVGAGLGLLVGGLFPKKFFAELADLITRFSGITICSIMTGVIWVGQPESFMDVILYDNLHVLLWVGGLFFALRGNRT